jgi:hypothetical protein
VKTCISQLSVSTRVLCLVFSLALSLSSHIGQAQSAAATGRLEGTVTDSTGAAVGDADVSVSNQNTGVSTSVRSSAEGGFVVLYLNPGTYEVSIRKNGFGKLVLKDITVSVGTRAILHPQLSLGKVESTVTVSADTPMGAQRNSGLRDGFCVRGPMLSECASQKKTGRCPRSATTVKA